MIEVIKNVHGVLIASKTLNDASKTLNDDCFNFSSRRKVDFIRQEYQKKKQCNFSLTSQIISL